MAVKKILQYPQFSHILKKRSQSAKIADPDLSSNIRDLKDTLRATEHGVGLAAPQIGILKRIFVLKKEFILKDLDKDSTFLRSADDIAVFINPKIISQKGKVVYGEGCLSVPDRHADIERAKVVKVRALDELGKQFYERLSGLAAIAVQQEIDHLDGILIVDHVK